VNPLLVAELTGVVAAVGTTGGGLAVVIEGDV
jgi:hypothetical protein